MMRYSPDAVRVVIFYAAMSAAEIAALGFCGYAAICEEASTYDADVISVSTGFLVPEFQVAVGALFLGAAQIWTLNRVCGVSRLVKFATLSLSVLCGSIFALVLGVTELGELPSDALRILVVGAAFAMVGGNCLLRRDDNGIP